MGGIILGKSTSEESEKLSLAIYALSEVATQKIKSGIILLEDELDIFCNSILARDEDAQIKLINDLCNENNSTDLLIEQLVPKTADKLGNMWKLDQVSFVDVSFAIDRLQKLIRIYKQYIEEKDEEDDSVIESRSKKGKIKLSSDPKLGYISSVEKKRESLEELFKSDSKES